MIRNEFEHAKSEKLLKEAAEEVENEFYLDAAKKFGEKTYEFSEKHNGEMEKLFLNKNKSTLSVLKRIAATAAVLIVCFTAAMQVEAFANPVKEMLFAHETVTVTEQRCYDIYHPEYLGPPISCFAAEVTFEFNGQNAKVISCEIIKVDTEEAVTEIEHEIKGDSVEISYICKDTDKNADNAVLVEETLVLKVTPDGNINGFV